MSRPRIVIDTNVLISAALKPDGQQAMVLQLIAFRAVQFLIGKVHVSFVQRNHPAVNPANRLQRGSGVTAAARRVGRGDKC